MNLLVGDIYTYVESPREHMAALAVIRNVCRARPADYRYMSKFRAHMWDGYISLMNGFANFPTGLLNTVCKTLDEENISYQLVLEDMRMGYRAIDKDCLHGITLRDYQYDVIQEIGAAGRGVVKMATGSGKTEVMAALIIGYGFPKTTIILHRKELLYQTRDRFQDRLDGKHKIGIVGDGITDLGDITVCMVQTLSSKLDDLYFHFKDNDLLMIDEVHHISSNQTFDVVFQLPGHYRYGFSGTPIKYDVLSDMKLVAATGPLLVDIGNMEMIELGYSAIPIVTIHKIPKETREIYQLDYATAYDELITHHDYRNILISQTAANSEGVVLILVNRVEHGKILHEMISDSTFVTGEDTTDYRKNVLDSMRNKDGVYIATPIFDEGIDVPAISTLILAGGGESHIRLLQRIGRGLRKKDVDNKLYVHDFMDYHNKFLKRHSLKRLEVYRGEGFDVSLG